MKFRHKVVCLLWYLSNHLQGSQIAPHRTNMTDLTIGSCFTHECRSFGAFRRPEGKTIPILGVVQAYNDEVFFTNNINVSLEAQQFMYITFGSSK